MSFLYANAFVFIRTICQFDEDMPFVIGKIIIGIDDAHGVVELEAEFKAQTAARIEGEEVSFVDPYADTRRDPDAFPRLENKVRGGKKVISCRTRGRAARQKNIGIIGGKVALLRRPIENAFAYFLKFGYGFHKKSIA